MNELAPLPNPFRDHVVQDAWQSPADVAEIHRDAFQACLAGIDAASRGEPDSLLVYGPAGSGKTHLLTRVQRHLAETARQAPDHVLRCVFVYVRLQTAPQLLWQHVRRRLVHDLMRRDEGLTQLQRLIAHQIAHHGRMAPRSAVMGVRVLGAEDPDALSNHIAEVSTKLGLSRDLSVVIEHLVHGRWIRDASAWLAGDSLPERALAGLGIGTTIEEDSGAAARETVLALCRLAAETLPIVFCFDQVEALLRRHEDREAFFRFGRFAADLSDADQNVFLLTCVQSAQLAAFQPAVLESDLDRFAKRRIPLDPLRPAEVESLALARLRAHAELAPLRAAHPDAAFYPLSSAFVKELSCIEPCVPRRVLAACARRFEEVQHGQLPRVAEVPAFLTAELDQRLVSTAARLGSGDTRDAIVRGAEVLAGLDRAAVIPRDVERDPPEIDVVLEQKGTSRRVAVSVRDEADGRSLRPRLAALVEHLPRPDGARLVIVRDPRVPLSSKAGKVREHLAELRARGAVVVEPTVEALAALATLSSLLADAKSGDLANEGETVGESAVLAWLRGLGERDPARLAAVDQLTSALFIPPAEGSVAPPPDAAKRAGDDAEDDARTALADLVTRRKVVEIEAAGREIEAPPDHLATLARQSPDRYLVLEGPPTLVLDMAGVVAEVEAAR
jgi:hypothetical protein